MLEKLTVACLHMSVSVEEDPGFIIRPSFVFRATPVPVSKFEISVEMAGSAKSRQSEAELAHYSFCCAWIGGAANQQCRVEDVQLPNMHDDPIPQATGVKGGIFFLIQTRKIIDGRLERHGISNKSRKWLHFSMDLSTPGPLDFGQDYYPNSRSGF